jgi:hypothetical protein
MCEIPSFPNQHSRPKHQTHSRGNQIKTKTDAKNERKPLTRNRTSRRKTHSGEYWKQYIYTTKLLRRRNWKKIIWGVILGEILNTKE